MRSLLGDERADVILCGHTHLPRVLPLADGTTVINPGSVGLPTYDHDLPVPHVMESGSPLARYALLHRTVAGWAPALRAIPYPWAAAAGAAVSSGWSGRAHHLRRPRVIPQATLRTPTSTQPGGVRGWPQPDQRESSFQTEASNSDASRLC